MFAETQQPVFLSEDWTGPLATQRLAQLLHALSSGKVPLTLKAPLTMEVPNGVSPFIIRNWSNGNTVMTFTDPSGASENTVTVGTSGVNTTTGGSTTTTTTTTTTGGNVIAAKIASGSGTTYTCTLYANGRGAASTGSVSATHPDIDAGEDIPDDTPCWVMRNSAGAYEIMGIPTWLE